MQLYLYMADYNYKVIFLYPDAILQIKLNFYSISVFNLLIKNGKWMSILVNFDLLVSVHIFINILNYSFITCVNIY